MTNTPYNKKRSCQTHKEGKENGAHNSGVLGLEKSELPIVANGPKLTQNQRKVFFPEIRHIAKFQQRGKIIQAGKTGPEEPPARRRYFQDPGNNGDFNF